MNKTGYVYMLANKPGTSIYTGVTSNLLERIQQHRDGLGSGFTTKYKCTILIAFQSFDSISDAIDAEKRIKKWPRSYKMNWIKSQNPTFIDLFPSLLNGTIVYVEPISKKGMDW